jgi:hypothetical protein
MTKSPQYIETLPRLIDQAMTALGNATTAAEILDARDQAKFVFDAAKSAARLAKAKGAHATVLAACHRMQADALTIEARAQSRIAEEYDAAQERGDVATPGNKSGKSNIPDENITPTAADIGLTSKQIHEARQVRDAEKREPGIVRKTVDAKLAVGEEPTRADVKRAVKLPQTTPSKIAVMAAADRATMAAFQKNTMPAAKKSPTEPKMTIPELAIRAGMNGNGKTNACDIIPDVETPDGTTDAEQRRFNFIYRASQAIGYGNDNGFEDAEAREITKSIIEAAREAATVWSDLVATMETTAGTIQSEPQFDPTTLSRSAKEKLDAAIRQEKRRLDAEHAARIHDIDEDIRSRVVAEGNEYLTMVKEREIKVRNDEKLWREMIDSHKPPFTVDQFKTILMCLHPDGVRTADKLADAFRLFNSKKLQLTGAKQHQSQRKRPRQKAETKNLE